ncbi:MAG: carbohydrate kinase family protein [Candidatus Aenigmarchaeota archaeon]|nr:carbohydrate kinase family protein [Candidatus Aenigmarchaeota archaeon]
MHVSVIGNVCLDLVIKTDKLPSCEEDLPAKIVPCIGGNAANSAIILSKLGAETTLHSKIGNDIIGKHLINEIENSNVTSKMETSKQRTAITLCFSQCKERSFLYDPGATNEFTIDDLDMEEIMKSDAVFVTGYSYLKNLSVMDLFKKAQENGLLTIFDPCPGRDVSEELKYTDILFANENEIKELSEINVKIVVIKKGADGCMAKINNKEIECKPINVDVVDTTGAGDAFNAGFIYKYLQTNNVEKAANFANKIGAINVTKIGAANITKEIEGIV